VSWGLLTVNKLTYPQLNIYYADLALDSKQLYNIYGYVRIFGKIDIDLFHRTIILLHEKYPILKSQLKETEERPYFEVQGNASARYDFIDLSHFSSNQDLLFEEIEKEKKYKFKLHDQLLFRNILYKLHNDEYVWLFNVHHIINDGWGASILVDTCSEIYENLLQNPDYKVEINNSFANYPDFEEKYISSEKYKKDDLHWRNKLEKLEILDLSKCFSKQKDRIEGGRVSRIIDKKVSEKINNYISEKAVSPHIFFMSIFYIYLYNLFKTKTIVIGTAVLNRPNAEFKSTVGMFLNFIPNFVELSDENTFSDILSLVQREMKQNFKHQRFPLVKLYQELGLNREDVYPFLFNYQNSVHNSDFASMPSDQEWLFNDYEEHAISLNINDRHNQGLYQFHFDFNKSMLSEIEMNYTIDRYFFLLEQILNDDKNLSDYSILPETEVKMVRSFLDGEKYDYPFISFASIIDINSGKYKNKIAISSESEKISYEQLSEEVNQFANYLLSIGIQKGDFVAVILNESIDLIKSLFALFKIGAVYIPIDPEYPSERIDYILEDCKAKLIISGEKERYNCIEPATLKNLLSMQSTKIPDKVIDPEDFAYSIYTSGSTGKPKGVLIQHKQISHYVNQFIRYFSLTECDVVAQQASIAFDTSLEEILPILFIGGRLEIIDRKKMLSVDYFVEELENRKITLLSSSPTLVSELNNEKFSGSDLRIIISGGDVLYEEQVDFLKEKYHVYNTYGPTESTICVSYADIKNDIVHLGKPIDNTSLYILNNDLEELGFSLIGELCISGEGLAHSYLNQNELTSQSFIHHPSIKRRLYKTGDLARLSPEGYLQYCGRKDLQVNLHGHRIELGEIDFYLMKHSKIKQSVTILIKNDKHQLLKSYCVLDNEDLLDTKEIIEFLLERLPEFMVPSFYKVLDKLPLTSNGKIDRKQLERISLEESNSSENELKTDLELKLANIWRDLLEKDVLFANDNFFSLGGHSLLAMKLIKEIKKQFDLIISFKEIFINPTIFELAALISKKEACAEENIVPVYTENGLFEASNSQLRLWTLSQFEDASICYNVYFACQLHGKINKELMKESFMSVVLKHESLRTTFIYQNSDLKQRIDKYEENKHSLCLRHLPEISVEKLKVILKNESEKAFDLEKGPLFKAELISIDESRHFLFMNIHHIVTDRWSINVLVEELLKTYSELSNRKEISLKELPFNYKDYSSWHSNLLKSDKLAAQKEYWFKQLKDYHSVLNIKTDRPRPKYPVFRGKTYHFLLDSDLYSSVSVYSKEDRKSLFTIVFSAYTILLNWYSKMTEFVIGTPFACRNFPGLESQMGLYINMLPLKIKIDSEKYITEIIEEINDTLVEAYENQDYPFDMIINDQNIKKELNRSPLFDTGITWNSVSTTYDKYDLDFNYEMIKLERNYVVNDLWLIANDDGETIQFEIEYKDVLFDLESIELFSERLLEVLKNITQNSKVKLSDIDFRTEKEKLLEDSRKIHFEFNF
jgi:amino acid adenylation domain-containing protein